MYVQLSTQQLIQQIQTRQVTVEIVATTFVDHILQNNHSGACLNAIIELNPSWRLEAQQLDKALQSGKPIGPLHGLPVIIKDHISTEGTMNTSAGSYFLQGLRFQNDATVVKKLKAAGALIIGKANMDEMASGCGIPSGRGGPIRNPYDLSRNASGSSGGVAAAVASGMATLGIGSDCRSSIRYPAADTSLVGLRPTFGLISRTGVLPFEPDLEVLSPITRSITDLALLLDCITGVDVEDRATRVQQNQPAINYFSALNPKIIQGKRIGVLRQNFIDGDPEIIALIEKAIGNFRKLGVEVIDPVAVTLYSQKQLNNEERNILALGSLKALVSMIKRCEKDSLIQTVEQLQFLISTAPFTTQINKHSPFFKITSEQLQAAIRMPWEIFEQVRDKVFQTQRFFLEKTFQQHQLDALIFPTKLKAPEPILPHPNYHFEGTIGYPNLASFSGCPELTLPAGYTSAKHPVGLSLLGLAFSESSLLSIALAYEQHYSTRIPPTLPTKLPQLTGQMPPLPTNELFENSLIIRGLTGKITGNLLRSNIEAQEPRHGTNSWVNRTVWYHWTAPTSGEFQLKVKGLAGGSFILAVYTGEQLTTLKEVACSNYPYQPSPKILTVIIKAQQDYKICVGNHGINIGNGSFQLSWQLNTL